MADVQNLIAARMIAAANILAAGTVNTQRGCSVVRTSQGVYTVTLDQEVDATQMIFQVTVGTASRVARVGNTNDAVKVITVIDFAAAVQDADLNFVVWALPPAA